MHAALVAGLAVYVVYITNFFRTSVSFHTPWERYGQRLNSSGYLRHAVDTGRCERKICALGRDVGILIGVLIVLREESIRSNMMCRRDAWRASAVAWGAALAGGVALNINFAIYMMPAACVDLLVQAATPQNVRDQQE